MAGLLTGLLAYYALDEASGDALDSHTTARHLTQSSDPVGTATGKVGNARDFENAVLPQTFQRFDSAFSFPGANDGFTVQAWIKPESLASMSATTGGGVVSYTTGDKAGDWWLTVMSDGKVSFGYFTTDGVNANGQKQTGAGTVVDGTWYHIVIRKGVGGVALTSVWINGVNTGISTATTSTGWQNHGLMIGEQYSTNVYRFDGLIDEVAIWNRSLNDTDIAFLYNGGLGRRYAELAVTENKFTEFYCDYSTGSNLNSGNEPGGVRLIYTSSTWVGATGVLTVSGIFNPLTDGVVVGDFASIYATGAVATGFVSRVIGVTSTTITVSLTAKAGTVPADGFTLVCRIGGCWKGPNALEDFPFGFMLQALNDGVNPVPRVNFKNAANYIITGSITHTPTDNGPVWWQGYTTTPGDGGRATLEVTASVAAFALLTLGSSACRRMWMEDFILFKNGTSSTATGLAFNSVMGVLRHVSARNMRGIGISVTGGGVTLIECEATNCNLSLTTLAPGISVGGNARAVRCYAYKNGGAGFGTSTGTGINDTFINCIAERNTEHGLVVRTVSSTAGGGVGVVGCDFYANGGSGVWLDPTSVSALVWVENSNFIANGRYGVEVATTSVNLLNLLNNGFGEGTMENVIGYFNPSLCAFVDQDNFLYPDDYCPYVGSGDPANFTLKELARHAGRGTNYPVTVTDRGYPDVGAVAYLSPDAPLVRSRLRR